jgi:hypothetical protein
MEPVARLSTGQSVTSYEDDGETDAGGPVPRVSTGQSWTSEDSEGCRGHNPLAGLKGIAVDAFDEREEEEDVATAAAAAAANSADGSLSVPTALPDDACVRAAEQYGTPLYLYSAAMLAARAEEALAFPAP